MKHEDKPVLPTPKKHDVVDADKDVKPAKRSNPADPAVMPIFDERDAPDPKAKKASKVAPFPEVEPLAEGVLPDEDPSNKIGSVRGIAESEDRWGDFLTSLGTDPGSEDAPEFAESDADERMLYIVENAPERVSRDDREGMELRGPYTPANKPKPKAAKPEPAGSVRGTAESNERWDAFFKGRATPPLFGTLTLEQRMDLIVKSDPDLVKHDDPDGLEIKKAQAKAQKEKEAHKK